MNDLEQLRARAGGPGWTRRDEQVLHALEHRDRQVERHFESVRFGALVAHRPDTADAARMAAGPLPDVAPGDAGELLGVKVSLVVGMRYDWVGLSVVRPAEPRDRGFRSAEGWPMSYDGVPYLNDGITVWHGFSAAKLVAESAPTLLEQFHLFHAHRGLALHKRFFVTERAWFEMKDSVRSPS